MNTRRFNRCAQALQVSRASNGIINRRQRGPSHALQGDANSQRKSASRGTTSFRHSQVRKLRERGAAAEVRVLAHDLPEVIAGQDYHPLVDVQMEDRMDCQPVDEFGWVDQDSEEEDEEEDETEVEKAARKVRVEYRDFRTRRDRTQTSNKSWGEQMEGMVDAYMDWCLTEITKEALPDCDKPSLWLDVIDMFGMCYLGLLGPY